MLRWGLQPRPRSTNFPTLCLDTRTTRICRSLALGGRNPTPNPLKTKLRFVSWLRPIVLLAFYCYQYSYAASYCCTASSIWIELFITKDHYLKYRTFCQDCKKKWKKRERSWRRKIVTERQMRERERDWSHELSSYWTIVTKTLFSSCLSYCLSMFIQSWNLYLIAKDQL